VCGAVEVSPAAAQAWLARADLDRGVLLSRPLDSWQNSSRLTIEGD
jgi:hypothetical protein